MEMLALLLMVMIEIIIEGEAGGLALGFVGVLRFAEEGEEDLELAGREAFLGGAVLRFI